MRLVTWNCGRGPYETKAGRLGHLAPDVAVLQECARPIQPDPGVAWFGANPRQGVAISVRAPYQIRAELVRGPSQSMFAARVLGPVEFRVVAVWAQQEPSYSEGLRLGILAYGDLLADRPCILVGDFNSSVAWETRHRRTDHRQLESRLRQEFGLVSAYHAATGEKPGYESRPTHFWRWQQQAPFHLDYCYIPEAWLPGLESVTVGSYEEWADSSDHRPVIVDVSPPGDIVRAAV